MRYLDHECFLKEKEIKLDRTNPYDEVVETPMDTYFNREVLNSPLSALRDQIYLDRFYSEEEKNEIETMCRDFIKEYRNLIMEKVPADCDNQDIDLAKAFLSMDEPQRTVEETKELKFGDKMRDFTLYDRKGNEHKLSEFKGKYIILEFTSKGCGPCLEAIPVLDWLYKRYKDKIGL